MSKMTTDNYEKHTADTSLWKFKFLQKFLINNFYIVLINEIKSLKPTSILDAGCGEGFTLSRLEQQNIGKNLEGIDFLEKAIKIGKKLHPKLKLRQGDIYKLPYRDNQFDLVICTEVLEHLEDPEKALKELKRITKKYCVISVPNEPLFMFGNFIRGKNFKRWGNDIEHINHWSTNAFIKFVSKEFKVKDVKTPLPWTMVTLQK
ncbi:MAG TPA: class I SAM-dependent methyltransferase [Candidatus Saccharimonadales bacterium]|nr:class I SAM-dependent methyltransferase [Candidatus Saccharimonadales bacterium]